MDKFCYVCSTDLADQGGRQTCAGAGLQGAGLGCAGVPGVVAQWVHCIPPGLPLAYTVMLVWQERLSDAL